ncbi:MAG: S41 family peptidase [Candidatus Omnitrophota bacterium]
MRKRILIGIAVCCLIFIITSISLSQVDKKNKEELFRQVGHFSDALIIIQEDYVDQVPSKQLIYGALKGMLASLDPHSQFMDPDIYNELKVSTEGKFGGLGIEITIKDGLLTVISPIEDTPAWKAGIKANDRIVKINDDLTRDMTLTEAVKKMRGKPGEAVILTILRESEKKIIEFKIVRAIIKIKDIKGARILEDAIGYIRIVEFRESTARNLDKALDNLMKQNMTALILDLRNNPGGLLDAAVKVAEKFIKKGEMVVYTKGRKNFQNLEFFSRYKDPILDIPMVVLINGGSASGSEIVAGCLQDYKRAIILGTKSFGKGSVQTVIPLGDGSALRLTTSKYFTPLGKVIHGKGVMPDIVVEEAVVGVPSSVDSEKEKIKEVFEEIENNLDKKDKQENKKVDKKKQDKEKLMDYKSDNQISSSIDILKAVRIYKVCPVKEKP